MRNLLVSTIILLILFPNLKLFAEEPHYFISASEDNTLKYWRISDGTCIRTFTGHSSGVLSVCFSSDYQFSLSGGSYGDNTLKYWKISDGACIRTFTGHSDYVKSVCIFPDRQYALSGSGDNTMKYWRLSDGTCLRTFTGHSADVLSVCISPDGQYILSGSWDNTLKYWKVSDGTCTMTFSGHGGAVWSVDISSDGQYGLSGSSDNTIKYWRLSDGTCLRTLVGHIAAVWSVSFSPDGQYALSGADNPDNTLKYWQISDGTCIRTFTGHSYNVYSVNFSLDGQFALSGSGDKTAKYWRISDGQCLGTFSEHNGTVWSAVFSKLNLKVTTPNGGEEWEVGSQQTISWTNVGEDSLNISYSTNSGSTWIQVTTVACDPNSYVWTVPDTPSEECLVRVCPKAGAPVDQSDAVFTIYSYKGYSSSKYSKSLPKTFSVNPNPFSDRLTITVPSSAAIYDITGRMITRLDRGKHELDTSEWKAGVYIVKAGKETKRIVRVEL